jgi:hypothetical protein
VLVSIVAAATLVATVRAATTNPCRLVTAADARAVLGVAVGRPKLQTLGLYQSCSYRAAGGVTVTIQSRRMVKSDFFRSAKANPGPVVPVSGLGAAAYAAGGGSVLLVWRNGTEVTFLVFGGGKGLAEEKRLAKRAVTRL